MTDTVREINNTLGKSWWDSLSPNIQLKYSLEQRAARHLFELSNRRASDDWAAYKHYASKDT